jgi:pimeloyl-ACP methyl ester carboxylesterase
VNSVKLPRALLVIAVAVTLASGAFIYGKFQRSIADARTRAIAGGILVQTRCGPLEYEEAGRGVPVLVVHGAGGGHDQGMTFARPLVQRGFRVIATSRFGYLGTPLPADASAQAQADAHACLLDALAIRQAAIIGVSAGGPSSIQFAIRHPDRCAALVLLVPLAWRPPETVSSATERSALHQDILARLVGSNSVFWSAMNLAPVRTMSLVLATPVEVIEASSATERERAEIILEQILPISDRAEGLRNDARIATTLDRYDLESIRAPTLVISLRDDLYGTFAGAEYTARHIPGARFVGYERGGHVFLEQHEAVLEEMVSFLGR